MKEAFIEKKFTPASLAMIEYVNRILDEYAAQGFQLTLRQLYYQLVSRAVIENTVRSYKNLGSLVSDARQAGMVDWEMIEDRNRETITPPHWQSPAQIVNAAARQFAIDKWEGQDYHIEVMVEKDALSGVLVPVCRELDIRLTANKGYCSSSTMYEIGKRLARAHAEDKDITILYLGDHDPSGIDMTRDVEDRLEMYSQVPIEVVRLALNYDQVQRWNPPENPAKTTDARYGAYARRFGESSWELDAVEPRQLATLVRDLVLERRDEYMWEVRVEVEARMRRTLLEFAETYKDEEGGEG